MSQIAKKFIQSNAVDETKIRLSNNANLKARNAANSADVNIAKVNASDRIEFASVPQTTSDGASANDLVRKSQMDAADVLKVSKSGDTMTGDLHMADGADIVFDSGTDGIISAAANLQLSPVADANILPGGNAFIATTAGDINLQAEQTGSAATAATTATSVGQADVARLEVLADNGGTSQIKGNINDANFSVERSTANNRLAQMSVGPAQEGQLLIDKTGANYSALLKANNTSIAVSDAAGVVITTDASGTTITGGNVDVDSNNIINLADPTAPQHAATKAYVDAVAEGLKPKEAVRAATLVNGALATAYEDGDVIDGVTLATGDRILIKDQTLPEENGIYIVEASGAPTRAPDFDSLTPIDEINGAYTFVQEGSQAGQGWVQTGVVAVLDTDPITFVYFNAVTGIIGGDMITVTGSTVSVDLAAVSGLESTTGTNSGELRAKVHAATVKINASNELESLKGNEQHPTLSGTDITNQYYDLSFAAYGTSASVNSISLGVVGGLEQLKGVDYTVSLTGGSGGVTRITFAGDLATGGPAALVAGDILMIKYSYLT